MSSPARFCFEKWSIKNKLQPSSLCRLGSETVLTKEEGLPTTLAVCGNLTIDELATNSGVRISPGGSALFASAAASHLGSRTAIIGNVGEDYPLTSLSWLRRHSLNVGLLAKVRGPTTRFRIVQRDSSRKLILMNRGRPLRPVRLRQHVQGIHLGPVFNEISLPLVKYYRTRCSFLSTDLQGFIRKMDSTGIVTTEQRNLEGLLKLCDSVQASIDEAKSQFPSGEPNSVLERVLETGPMYCLITFGSRGSMLGIRQSEKYKIPAYPEESISDTTGAGDILAGSWLSTLLSKKDPVWAAAVGSAFASLASRKTGFSKFRFSRKELFRRAEWIYDRVQTLRDN